MLKVKCVMCKVKIKMWNVNIEHYFVCTQRKRRGEI